ncbi:hypothetical protein D3C76_1105870 [compost metagenome]
MNGQFDHPVRLVLQHVASGSSLQTTRIVGVTVVHFLSELLTGQFDLVGVNHNDEIAAVYMRGKIRFMFTANDTGHFTGQTAEGFAFGVYEIPFAFGCIAFRHICRTHLDPPKSFYASMSWHHKHKRLCAPVHLAS